jgi:hypothetical protein
MNNQIVRYFPYVVTASLVVAAIASASPAFAYAAVLSLASVLVRESFLAVQETRSAKSVLPDETKRLINDLAARVTTIEVGIQRRGF